MKKLIAVAFVAGAAVNIYNQIRLMDRITNMSDEDLKDYLDKTTERSMAMVEKLMKPFWAVASKIEEKTYN